MLEKLSTHQILTLMESNKGNPSFDSIRQMLAAEVLKRYSEQSAEIELKNNNKEHSE